jgi:Zn-dependent peptidase ImmA (M78 family)
MNKKVIIGGQKFSIKKKKGVEELSYNYDGKVCYHKNKIVLNSNCNDKYIEETLAHEIIHCFLEKTGASNLLKSKEVDHELITEMLSNIFWQFLRDNTNFFDKKEIFRKVRRLKRRISKMLYFRDFAPHSKYGIYMKGIRKCTKVPIIIGENNEPIDCNHKTCPLKKRERI